MTDPLASTLKTASADVTGLESKALALEHKFLANAKSWIPIAGFALLVILNYLSVASKMIEIGRDIVELLLILHYVGPYVVDICNAAVEVAKQRAWGEIQAAKASANGQSVSVDGNGHTLNLTNASLAATHPTAPASPT